MNTNKMNRWGYALAGTIVLLFAGLVYAWSVLSSPVGVYFSDWGKAQLSLTFTICMGFFCFGCLFGGITSDKLKAKVSIWISAALFFVGFLVASKAYSPMVLYIGYGVICGFASGVAYNTVMSTISSWFPDKQGLISGILLMGFGLGGFVIGKIYQVVTPMGAGVDAWRTSFFVFGIILFVVLGVCGIFFVKATEEDLARIITEDNNIKLLEKEKSEVEVTPTQMLKTYSFWLYFAWAILLSGSGLALISQATGVVKEVGKGIGPGTIATVVGLISIFNGIGRVIFGNMFDKLGRSKTMTIITVAFALSVGILILAVTQKNFMLIIAGFICTGFSYGGINPTNSAFISLSYGRQNYPMNFSLVNMNLLISSFGGTIAGVLYDKSGSYLSTFIFMMGATAVAMICSMLIKKSESGLKSLQCAHELGEEV